MTSKHGPSSQWICLISLVNDLSECNAEHRSFYSSLRQQFHTSFAAVRQKLGISDFDWIWPRMKEHTRPLGRCQRPEALCHSSIPSPVQAGRSKVYFIPNVRTGNTTGHKSIQWQCFPPQNKNQLTRFIGWSEWTFILQWPSQDPGTRFWENARNNGFKIIFNWYIYFCIEDLHVSGGFTGFRSGFSFKMISYCFFNFGAFLDRENRYR